MRSLLAANIKAGRKKLGLSQEKFAEFTELSTQTISDIEGCRTWVSDQTLLKLSEVLKVEIFQLLVPMLDGTGDEAVFLPEKVNKLRQFLKEDIDTRLDQFLLDKNNLKHVKS